MRRMLKIIYMLAIAALSAATMSCNHKDLCYEHGHKSKLRVQFDWRDAPEANPKGMCVFFYSADNEDVYYRFDFDNTVGGEIEIPDGRYLLISYNNDTELVRFSATNSFTAHTAYTRNGDLLEPLYGNGISSGATTDNGERVVITPDNLWGCHVSEVTVNTNGADCCCDRSIDCGCSRNRCTRADSPSPVDTDYQTITLYPHDMLCHYSYEVRNVENADRISRISAALSGMSPALNMVSETPEAEPVTLPVPGQADGTSRKITGQFLTFGHNTANSPRHLMSFYVIMDDGSKYSVKGYPNLDVTDQVDGAPDQRHVHIIIDGLKLPDRSDPDSGFNPSVDDWGVKDEDIKI